MLDQITVLAMLNVTTRVIFNAATARGITTDEMREAYIKRLRTHFAAPYEPAEGDDEPEEEQP